jgi:hypothetical protein
MRTLLAGLAVTAAAAGCAGGGSGSHSTLTAAQALHQARTDGFTQAVRGPRGESWQCSARSSKIGPAQTTGKYAGYRRPVYTIEFGDRGAPPTNDNTGRIAMAVFVFADAGLAARCAHAGIYTSEHYPVHPEAVALGNSKTLPYKLIAGTTVETHMHKRDLPGAVFPSDGQYETFIASGRAFAIGLAYTEHDSRIVQRDLARIAAEISG